MLPGDGSAEWGGDMDPRYIPHAYDPAQGFIATANNDPIGVTDDDDPFFDEPMVDGAPLYLGADYDPGTRVGRITKRIKAITDAGGKLTLDDMQSIQADAVSEWAQVLAPTFVDAAQALQRGDRLAGRARRAVAVGAAGEPAVEGAAAAGAGRGRRRGRFDTAVGVAEDQPTAQQIADSQAAVFMQRLDPPLRRSRLRATSTRSSASCPGTFAQLKLLTKHVQQRRQTLKTGHQRR